MNTKASGVFYALITAICLGAITTQAKVFFSEGGNALTLMFFRFICSVVLMGVFIAIRKYSFEIHPRARWAIFWIGAVWSGSMILYVTSVQTISVSIAVLLLYTYPIIVLLVAMMRKQLTVSIRLLVVFSGAFVGLCLALFTGQIALEPVGVSFALLAGMGAAYTFIKGASVAPNLNPMVMTFWVNAVGLLMILPLIINKIQLPMTYQAIMALAGATLCYIVAISCQFQALSKLPAARAAFLLNLEPVVSILLATLFLSEALTGIQSVGVVLVLSMLFYSCSFTFRKVS